MSVAVPLILGIEDGAGMGSSPTEQWENWRPVQEMWLPRWIAKTQQKRISENKLLWESKNTDFLTLTNLFVRTPRQQILSWRNLSPPSHWFFFSSCPFFPNKRPYIQQYLGTYWCILRKDQIQFKFSCLQFQAEFCPPVLTPMGVTLV